MRGADALADELTELRALGDSQQRGYRFEDFVAKVLRQDHFSVVSNAGVSRPRQVDALAVRGELIYLVETKWRRSKANVNDVDSLATRLQSTSPTVVGLLVSYSGFTSEAVARTEQLAQRPIALVTGEELENSLWPGDFVRLVRRKIESLVTHRSVLFVATNPMRPLKPSRGRGGLPAATQSSFQMVAAQTHLFLSATSAASFS